MHLHGTLQGGLLRSELGVAAALPEGDHLSGAGGIRVGQGAAEAFRNLAVAFLLRMSLDGLDGCPQEQLQGKGTTAFRQSLSNYTGARQK